MRRIIVLILLAVSIFFNHLYSQKVDENGNYLAKFPDGKVRYFDRNLDKIALSIQNPSSINLIDQSLAANQIFLHQELYNGKIRIYKNPDQTNTSTIKTILSTFQSLEYIYPLYIRRDTGTEFVLTNEIIINFHDFVTTDARDQYLKKYDLHLIRKLSAGSYLVKLNSSNDVSCLNLIDILSYRKDINWIYPNWIQMGIYSSTYPNDPEFDVEENQWAFGKIKATNAWDFISPGEHHNVKIGFIDSGADLDHPDLGSNIFNTWYYNGYPEYLSSADDIYGHGTEMAGTACAVTNNETGVAGIGWNPGLVVIRYSAYDYGDAAGLDDAISWASQNNRTDIINMSIYWDGEINNIKPAIDAAIANGIVVIASTGNDDYSEIDYPASHADVIAVGASNQNDSRWFEQILMNGGSAEGCGSNYGEGLDIVAPGSVDECGSLTGGNLTTYLNGDYELVGGTSYATALVSGVAALLKIVNPDLSRVQIKEALVKSADKVGGYTYDPIIFTSANSSPSTGDWGGIKIYGEGSLEYCHIEYATYGVYANRSTPTIQNCEIVNCSSPIYIYKSNYVSGEPLILSNTISGTSSGYGIYLYESSPDIRQNIISGFSWGSYCKASSSPNFGSGSTYGANQFINNYGGLKAYIDCYPFLGKGTNGGGNIFDSNHSYYIDASKYCEIDAENNWWGTTSPPSSKFTTSQGSTIDYVPWLTSPPLYKIVSTNDHNGFYPISVENSDISSLIIEDNSGSLCDQSDIALYLYLNGDYQQSWEICTEIIDSSPDLYLALHVQNLLWQIAGKGKTNSGYNLIAFREYLQNQVKNEVKNELSGYSKVILSGFEEEQDVRLRMLDEVILEYADSFVGEAALFSKMMYYYHEVYNPGEFEKLLNYLKLKFPESELIADGTLLLQYSPGDTLRKETITERIIPLKYWISNAYPNPFNPSTTIRYEIPKNSDVRVRIFNNLGQIVKEYLIFSQTPGFHSLTWSGINNSGIPVPSGVYYILLKAESIEGDGENFLKPIKVVLIK
jgi:thermitase